MTTFNTIADADIDPESPGTATLFTRLRDNPIAMYERDPTAPALPVVTGFTGGSLFYIDDDGDGQGSNTFDIDAAIGAAWESVGPTGSGATNIWTALDAIPSSAKWIELEIFNDIVATASAGYALAYIYMRRNGSSASKDNGTLKSASIATYIATTGGGSANITTAKVPVTSRKFDVYKEITSTSGGYVESSYMKVIGFGV